MQRISLTALVTLTGTLCFACDSASTSTGGASAAAVTSSVASAAASQAPGNAPSTAGAPKVAKPKPYKFTEAQALGTLPDGVGIAVGEKAPDFELADAKGDKLSLKSMIAKGPVMLVFYRGGW